MLSEEHATEVPPMNDVIVTIGRENGSGGREVGSILAGMLGVKCYDRALIEATAERAGTSVDEVRSSEERRGRGHLYFGGIPAPNPLFRSQSEVILDLASQGPCVFVGRCADYVLRDRDDVVNVFITAPIEDRIRRSARRNGISEGEAGERVASTDRDREEYYRRYTGRAWGSVSNYDISIDTGRIGVENAARLVMEYIGMRS